MGHILLSDDPTRQPDIESWACVLVSLISAGCPSQGNREESRHRRFQLGLQEKAAGSFLMDH
jgi:hypothetical protein